MTAIDKRGLYVHIPFCIRKCNYCDFCSSCESDDVREQYVDTLCREIASFRDMHLAIDTVYLGGGTPSVLMPQQTAKILNAIKSSFDLTPDAEITTEINPGTVSAEKLVLYKELGINRISIGLQSIHENELKILGRIHTYDDFIDTYKLLRELGFLNIGVDIMYGIPEQTRDSFAKTVRAVADLSPEHISAYGLIIEKGTPFFDNKDNLELPSEDDECDMYYDCAARLCEYGYRHYEISNYAKPGCESRHNLKYWNDEEYLAVGLAAHSYLFGVRYAATEKLSEYFQEYGVKYKRKLSEFGIDPTEYVMLRLRLDTGISLKSYRDLFGKDLLRGKEQLIARLKDGGYIELDSDTLRLTEKGFYISNSIISALI